MIKTILKIIVAFLIFYWLINSGKLDFGLVLESLKHPLSIIFGITLIMIQVTAAAFRFGFLLRTRSPDLSFKKIIGIQWIAQLFSTVLPGGFTSDLMKIGYVREMDVKLSKSFIFFIMLLDRIIGLSSLLFISGVMSLLFFKELTSLNSMMERLIILNISLFILTLVGGGLFFANERVQPLIISFIPGQRFKNLAKEMWSYSKHIKLILIAYLLNVCSHLIGILAFWIVTKPFYEAPISFKFLATLIPIGFLSTVIPISPGGIGVGHAAFSTLFNFIHQTNGASLYNIFWIMLIITNCIGVFPFLLRKKISKDQV